jgi:hypothetical protein
VDVEDVGGDEAGRDAVDAGVVDPFDGEAFGEVDDGGFGGVVLLSGQVRSGQDITSSSCQVN